MYIELARRVGLKASPVILPSHTFVKPEIEGVDWVVDPFNGGQVRGAQHSTAQHSAGTCGRHCVPCSVTTKLSWAYSNSVLYTATCYTLE